LRAVKFARLRRRRNEREKEEKIYKIKWRIINKLLRKRNIKTKPDNYACYIEKCSVNVNENLKIFVALYIKSMFFIFIIDEIVGVNMKYRFER